MRLFCLFAWKSVTDKLLKQHNLVGKGQNYSNWVGERVKSRSDSRVPTMLATSDAKMTGEAKREVLRVFDRAVTSVLPGVLINTKVKLVDCAFLLIDGVRYPITKHVYVVGFGKAVAGMAYAMERILDDKLVRGIVSVPRQPYRKSAPPEFEDLREMTEKQLQELQMLKRSRKIEYLEGGSGNQPDDDSVASTKKIVALAEGLGRKDTLVVLISGGGSALLSLPKKPLTSAGKRDLCMRLQNAGASITELNHVRKRLSVVKAGGLARIAYPAKVIALVLSDIVRDPIEFIASGPTCPFVSDSAVNDAIEILKKYNIYDGVGKEVQELLSSTDEGTLKEEAMIEDGKFKHVTNILIGNNLVALKAAEEASRRFDLASVILSNTVEGDVKEVSYAYAKFTRSVCHILERNFCNKLEFVDEVLQKNVGVLDIAVEKLGETFDRLVEVAKGKSALLLFGGEPTVTVQGDGKGGRNQELALRFSLDWLSEISKDPVLINYFVLFLSVGTDGQDGPTDAAGAFGEPAFRPKMMSVRQDLLERKDLTLDPDILKSLKYKIEQIERMLPERVLKRNDSNTFYSKFVNGKYLVRTGLTGTNVMDLNFIYVRKRECECNVQRATFVCDYLQPKIGEDPIFVFDKVA
ncbi:PREDICTED: glycerate kinase [Ceratosolen solmsi marchali]|uniref:Glycerate kinase n=1 Tax=Ceratosolen solmsi marchali TaxID=326594 RepID=A0AAJ7DU92_9HYME|nr:PREDICTED: glycerate kinase [Ceratosolen solmsi marchali]